MLLLCRSKHSIICHLSTLLILMALWHSLRMPSSLEWIYTVLKRFARYICVVVAPGNTYINSAEKGISNKVAYGSKFTYLKKYVTGE